MRTTRRSTSLRQFAQKTTSGLAVMLAVLLLVGVGIAQEQTPAAAPDSQSQPSAPSYGGRHSDNQLTVPAGTHLALVLTHPIDTKVLRRGDIVYAQVTDPVTAGTHVLVPAGTFVQGRIDKLTRRGSRSELAMQSISLVFPDGYVATITERTMMESGEGTALVNPGGPAKAGAIIAPMAGAGLGTLIGSAAHTTQSSTLGGTTITSSTPKGMAIGAIVGSAAGAVISIALLLRSRDFYVEVGSPMEMTLTQPLTLAGIHEPNVAQQPPTIAIAPVRPTIIPAIATQDHGICYTPDIPGTPSITIPGTPPVGDSPGTPDTVIPGTPPTPGTAYPCP